MEEIDIWLKENKNEISHQQLKKIKKQTILRKLLHLKFNKNYKNCFKILMQNYTSFIIFKMLIIIFTPIYILKKVSRFHI